MTTVVFQPGPVDGYDTYVNEEAPDTNYETEQSHGIVAPTPNRRTSFINFFLASIPTGSIVQSAKLSVYTSLVDAGEELLLQKVIDAWYVDTLTWNNRPLPGTKPIVGYAEVNTWCEFDVKEIVQEWINNPLWNLGVQISAPLCDETITIIYSSDYLADPTKRPKLSVTYEPPAAGEQAAKIYLSTPGITIPSGVNTLVPLNAKDIGNDYLIYLPGSMLYPIEPGYYNCTGQIAFTDIVGTCWVIALLYKNGIAVNVGSGAQRATGDVSIASTLLYFDGVNDYLQLYVYQTNGAARTVANSAAYTCLSIAKVGK